MCRPLCAAAAALLLAVSFAARAASVASVSPQGEVAQVRQIVVKFSGPVVAFGDLRLADPFSVQCVGAAPSGSGRWASDRVWLYDFREAVPPGTRCTLKARPDWKPSDGALTGSTDYSFSTGGPAVVSAQPWNGAEIEEDQHFLLELNGLAVESTLAANAWCEVEGIGERLPLRVVGGAAREAVLKARHIAARRAEKMLLVTCARPLPNDAALRLVWGKGIAAAVNPGIVTRIEQRFDYRVRKPFTAEFSCERERAGAPCMPILPMSLRFSAPVPRALAEKARLKPAQGGEIAPVFDKDEKAEEVRELRFPRLTAENSSFTIELPRELKDNAGRPLANAALFPLTVKTGSAPPIAKFAAAPFGVVELNGDAMLPVTLRHVQADLRPAAPSGQVRVKRLSSDADMLSWYARLKRADESEWASRDSSLLAKESDAKRLDLPQLQGGDPRPFEVIGIPFSEPGYHVVEIESRRLGESLLDKKAPMFVRTGVLVTNLGVHFKRGRENGLVWVTTLDRGKPVDGADVAVNDCNGVRLWAGRTDAQGLARVPRIDSDPDKCAADMGLFVTARRADKKGVVDTEVRWADVERTPFTMGDPITIEPNQFSDAFEEQQLWNVGHGQARGGAIQASEILTRAKECHTPAGGTMRFEALEDGLAIMERSQRRRKRDWAKGNNLRRLPGTCFPIGDQHVVAEGGAEFGSFAQCFREA